MTPIPINFFSLFVFIECHKHVKSVSVQSFNGTLPSGATFPDYRITRSHNIKQLKHPDEPVPGSFDARDEWPHCESIGRIANEGRCDFCWAISVSMTLTDRLCIQSNGTDTFEYSAENLLSCCSDCFKWRPGDKCEGGGTVGTAIQYLEKHGVASGGDMESKNGCIPISPDTVQGRAPSCHTTCTNPDHKFSNKRYSDGATLLFNNFRSVNTKQVQIEVMKNGPVIFIMQSTQHFTDNYQDGVYQEEHPVDNVSDYTHVVRLVGWGTEEGTPYWLVANTKGKSWGRLGGFFKIQKDKNCLLIESIVFAPIPRTKGSALIQEISGSILLSCIFVMFLKYFLIF